MNKLQQELKSLRTQMEDLQKKYDGSVMPEDAAKSFIGMLDQAKAVKSQIDANDAFTALKDWQDAPDGTSAVKSSYTRDALPGEGDIDGVTADPNTGEMYATSKSGEAKLAALKSGAYKDAYNAYIRNKGLGRSLNHGLKGDALKVMQEGIDTAGGQWVIPDFRSELVSKVAANTAIRQNAYVFTTGSNEVSFPKVNYTTDDKYTSGVRMSWVAEAPASAYSEATNPISGRATIGVNLATVKIIMTRQMLEDGQFDVMGYANQKIVEAFASGGEDVYINGTGFGQPQGILSHPNATTASSSGGMYVASGVSGSITWMGVASGSTGTNDPTKGLIGLEAALPPQYEANAMFIGKKETFAAVRSLVDTSNRPLWQAVDGVQTSWVKGLPPTLLGYPFAKTQFAQAIAANAYPMIFGDIKAYYIADRVGISVEVFRELRGDYDEVVLYARWRTGGQLVEDWRVKLLKLAAS